MVVVGARSPFVDDGGGASSLFMRRVKARRLCSLMVVAGARGCLWALGVVR
jgi:hypothetical protein